MKRFFLVTVAFFLLLMLFGCNQRGEANETNPLVTRETDHTFEEFVDEQKLEETTRDYKQEGPTGHPWPAAILEFTSLEQLIESKKTGKEGISYTGSYADEVERAKFAALDKLYVPTVIPEGYQLYKIHVSQYYVSFQYYTESDMVSRDAIINAYYRKFVFSFYRRDSGIDITMDNALQQHNATKEDLVDGKYLFAEPDLLYWEFDGERLSLNMPRPLLEKQPDKQKKIAEMIRYTEVVVVDLGG